MLGKMERVTELLGQGVTNKQIFATLRDEYGSAVSTATLAALRKTIFGEGPTCIEPRKRPGSLQEKMKLIEACLRLGQTGMQCQKALRAKYGSGVDNSILQAVRTKLAEQGQSSDKIIPVSLPPEMYREPVESEDLVISPLHGPNGTTADLRAVQQWMESIDAQSINLTVDGKLTVVVHHQFDLGDVQ